MKKYFHFNKSTYHASIDPLIDSWWLECLWRSETERGESDWSPFPSFFLSFFLSGLAPNKAPRSLSLSLFSFLVGSYRQYNQQEQKLRIYYIRTPYPDWLKLNDNFREWFIFLALVCPLDLCNESRFQRYTIGHCSHGQWKIGSSSQVNNYRPTLKCVVLCQIDSLYTVDSHGFIETKFHRWTLIALFKKCLQPQMIIN